GEAGLAGREPGHEVEDAHFPRLGHRGPYRPYESDSGVVPDPAGHVVIAAPPVDLAVLVTDGAQPLDEIADARRAGERQHRLEISHAVERVESGREDFRRLRRADEGVRPERAAQQEPRETLDPGGGGDARPRLRKKLLDLS